MHYADVVLPSAAWSEENGTYTNCERRVSRMRKAVSSPGEAKPETWIFTELAKRLGLTWENRTKKEIWDNEIIKVVPFLKDLTYDRLERGGVCWTCRTRLRWESRALRNSGPRSEDPDGLLLIITITPFWNIVKVCWSPFPAGRYWKDTSRQAVRKK